MPFVHFLVHFVSMLRLLSWAVFVLLTFSTGLRAETADKFKPIIFDGVGTLTQNAAKQKTTVEGQFTLTKGSLVLRAAKLEVEEDAKGNQSALAIAGKGHTVFFRQKREGLLEFFEGEAEQVRYESKLDQVVLTGRAKLRRLRGSTLIDESAGEIITLNNMDETLKIDSAPQGKSASSAGGAGTNRPGGVGGGATGGISPSPQSPPITQTGRNDRDGPEAASAAKTPERIRILLSPKKQSDAAEPRAQLNLDKTLSLPQNLAPSANNAPEIVGGKK